MKDQRESHGEGQGIFRFILKDGELRIRVQVPNGHRRAAEEVVKGGYLFSNASQRCEPRKPAPPATRALSGKFISAFAFRTFRALPDGAASGHPHCFFLLLGLPGIR
jgi:hypothetical protein